MSDRIVVFTAGRIEQVGRARRGVRAARPARSSPGFVGTSNLLRGEAAMTVLGHDGVSASGPRRSGSSDPVDAARRGRRRRSRDGARGRLRRAAARGSSSTSTSGARSSRSSRTRAVVLRRARDARPPGAADLATRARVPVARLSRHSAAIGTAERHSARTHQAEPSACFGSRRISVHQSSCVRVRSASRPRPRAAACSSGVVLAAVGPRAARARRRAYAGPVGAGEGTARRCWPGPATPRTAPPTRRSTGSTPFEQETGCKVNVKTFAHLGRGRPAVRHRATTTWSPPRATPRCGWSTATTCSRSTPRWCPTTPTSSRT